MANRSDAFWGTDIDIDSIWTWNSKLSFWTFKYLGTHKQLTPFHSGGYAQREACALSLTECPGSSPSSAA